MKNLTKTKAFLLACIFSLLLFLIVCWSAAFQDTTPYWVESIGYFLFTYICLMKFTEKVSDINSWMVAFAIILGRIILEVPLRIIDWHGTFGSFMITVGCVVAILLAVVCFKDKRIYSFILSYVILALFNSAIADLWHQYWETMH